jgi:hypothetical protein
MPEPVAKKLSQGSWESKFFMSHREEIKDRLRNEYHELDRCIGELKKSADSAKGGVRLYRQQRLNKVMEDRARLGERLRLVSRQEGEKRWFDAEKLWSDLRNAVLQAGTN